MWFSGKYFILFVDSIFVLVLNQDHALGLLSWCYYPSFHCQDSHGWGSHTDIAVTV